MALHIAWHFYEVSLRCSLSLLQHQHFMICPIFLFSIHLLTLLMLLKENWSCLMGMPLSHWQMGNLPVSLHILSAFPPNLSAHASLLLKGLAQTIWPCFSFMKNVSLLEFSHWNYSLKTKQNNHLSDPHISNVFPSLYCKTYWQLSVFSVSAFSPL